MEKVKRAGVNRISNNHSLDKIIEYSLFGLRTVNSETKLIQISINIRI